MSDRSFPEGTGDPAQTRTVETPERFVVGLATRASNAAEREGEPGTGPIVRLWGAFMQRDFPRDIPNQAEPGEIVAVYTDFDSDAGGEYLAVLGRTVTSLDTVPETLVGTIVPSQTMASIAVRGDLSQTVPATWERIIEVFTPDYRLQRTFVSDIDVYPTQPSEDGPTGTVLVGIRAVPDD